MILRHALLLTAFPLCGLIPSSGIAQELDALKDTTERWIATRNRISKDSSQWVTEKEILQGSIDTLESTRDILTENVAILELQSKTLTEAISASEAEVAAFEKTNEFIQSHVARYEQRIQKLADQLPTPLRDEIAPLLRKIPDQESGSSSTPLPNRLQNVVAITTIIDEFNNDLTLTHTIKTLDDGSVIEVRVLYWGLATAYASSTDGSKAWILSPANGEWTWKSAAENAPAIKSLFDVYDKTIDPALVQIPFNFQKEGGAK